MALTLSNLTLSHFRSHKRARLLLDGRPVALWGPNGAGKTNVLEAVSLLSPGRGLRRAAADDLIRRPEALGWKITAEIAGPDLSHRIETWAEPATPRQVRIDDKTAPQTALASLFPMLWLTPVMDRLWLEAPEARRRFLDRMVMAFVPDHAAATLAYEKAMRERNRLLRDQVADARWYDALEAQMAQTGAQITANRLHTLDELARHIDPDSPFPAADLALDCTAPTDPDALRDGLARARRQDMAAGRSLTGPHRADLRAYWAAKGVEAAQGSTGEQKALLLSLILTQARALARHGRPPILLLDEVAAHLDTARRAMLHDALCALQVQAFLTGTGPELFADLGARAQHFHITEQDGLSGVAQADS
jgi:DNA replication and repair protein RecF